MKETQVVNHRKAILINGLPASGKTSVGRKIAENYNVPLLSLDVIKEAMFEELGIGDRDYNRKLGHTCKRIIWSILADFPKDALVIIDAWFGMPPHDEIIQSLSGAQISTILEIWCHAPGSLLKSRYVDRVGNRHKGHPGKEYGDELIKIAKIAEPMRIGPVYFVNTSDYEKINYCDIFNWIEVHL